MLLISAKCNLIHPTHPLRSHFYSLFTRAIHLNLLNLGRQSPQNPLPRTTPPKMSRLFPHPPLRRRSTPLHPNPNNARPAPGFPSRRLHRYPQRHNPLSLSPTATRPLFSLQSPHHPAHNPGFHHTTRCAVAALIDGKGPESSWCRGGGGNGIPGCDACSQDVGSRGD